MYIMKVGDNVKWIIRFEWDSASERNKSERQVKEKINNFDGIIVAINCIT
jgi:hypothetical protein